ncbi:hypothetical protein [Streptomyces achromogenes]|uniref:hypothetical protein n=1 Tax=Streptomyces achromogenes TaxID=67255 RepID=UPI0036AED058
MGPAPFAVAQERISSALVECVGTIEQTYSPGLLLIPRETTYEGVAHYTTCPVSDGVVTSGIYREVLTYTASCSANGGPSQGDITWSNGQRSHLVTTGVEVDVVGNLQVFTSVAQVFSGRYVGHLANIVTILPNITDLAACLAPPGLTANQGTATLTILP